MKSQSVTSWLTGWLSEWRCVKVLLVLSDCPCPWLPLSSHCVLVSLKGLRFEAAAVGSSTLFPSFFPSLHRPTARAANCKLRGQIECKKIDGVDNGGKLAWIELNWIEVNTVNCRWRWTILNAEHSEADNRPNRGRIENCRLTPATRQATHCASGNFLLPNCLLLLRYCSMKNQQVFASLRHKNGWLSFSLCLFYLVHTHAHTNRYPFYLLILKARVQTSLITYNSPFDPSELWPILLSILKCATMKCLVWLFL